MENNETLTKVLHQLELIRNLLAYQTFHNTKMSEGAPVLKKLGFSNPEIASVFDSNAKAVSVRLAEAKRKK